MSREQHGKKIGGTRFFFFDPRSTPGPAATPRATRSYSRPTRHVICGACEGGHPRIAGQLCNNPFYLQQHVQQPTRRCGFTLGCHVSHGPPARWSAATGLPRHTEKPWSDNDLARVSLLDLVLQTAPALHGSYMRRLRLPARRIPHSRKSAHLERTPMEVRSVRVPMRLLRPRDTGADCTCNGAAGAPLDARGLPASRARSYASRTGPSRIRCELPSVPAVVRYPPLCCPRAATHDMRLLCCSVHVPLASHMDFRRHPRTSRGGPDGCLPPLPRQRVPVLRA